MASKLAQALVDAVKEAEHQLELDDVEPTLNEQAHAGVEQSMDRVNEDRSPIHSGMPSAFGGLQTEYGANPAIKKHMNRQLFGALQKSKARRNKK
jgi:hypothetical protein